MDPSAPSRHPYVDAAGGRSPRWPPFGALAAAGVLVATLTLVAAAVAGVPPFSAADLGSPTPSSPPPSATAVPSASPTATPSPAPPSADEIRATLARIARRMTEVRELPAVDLPESRLVTSDEAGRLLTENFRAENPPDFLADQTLLYRALGLLDEDENIGAVFERFLSTQVIGFYRDTDGALYIVSDQAFGPLQELTVAHEYTHALQDGTFDLGGIRPDGHDQGDLALARLALVEGDATLAMTQWALEDLTPAEIQALVEALDDPLAERALAKAPAIVRETQTFAYNEGLAFVQRAWARGGWSAVDGLWDRPPDTTEQILHPQKYDAEEAALDVSLPNGVVETLGEAWELALADTHGELLTRIWLAEVLAARPAADAAAGWGGDRVGLYRGPDDAWALVWWTGWDTPADATDFKAGADAVVPTLNANARVVFHGVGLGVGNSVAILVASDAATLRRVASALPIP